MLRFVDRDFRLDLELVDLAGCLRNADRLDFEFDGERAAPADILNRPGELQILPPGIDREISAVEFRQSAEDILDFRIVLLHIWSVLLSLGNYIHKYSAYPTNGAHSSSTRRTFARSNSSWVRTRPSMSIQNPGLCHAAAFAIFPTCSTTFSGPKPPAYP